MKTGDRFGTVVATFAPLRTTPAGRLEVRILEIRGERRLDVRQYVTSHAFVGYTRKGILLTAEEFRALLAQLDEIKAALEGPRALEGDRTAPVETTT